MTSSAGSSWAAEQVVEAGPLDLDHRRLAAAEGRPVGLADRGRGQRLEVEGGEGLLDRPAQLLLDEGTDLLCRDGPHRGAQMGELVDHRLGQQVAAGGGDLSELDEHPAHLLDGQAEPVAELGGGDPRGREELGPGQPVAPRRRQHLPRPREGGQAAADPPDGVQPQPFRPGSSVPGAATADSLGDDHQDHGGEHPEQGGEGVGHGGVAAPPHHRLGPDRPDDGADQGGGHRAPPADADAEQTAAHQAEHDHEEHGEQEGEHVPEREPDGDGTRIRRQ
jgi:hypothetical protein